MSTSEVEATVETGARSVEDASEDASLRESRAAAATVFNRLLESSAPGLAKELLIFWENIFCNKVLFDFVSVLGYFQSNLPKKEGIYNSPRRQRNREEAQQRR